MSTIYAENSALKINSFHNGDFLAKEWNEINSYDRETGSVREICHAIHLSYNAAQSCYGTPNMTGETFNSMTVKWPTISTSAQWYILVQLYTEGQVWRMIYSSWSVVESSGFVASESLLMNWFKMTSTLCRKSSLSSKICCSWWLSCWPSVVTVVTILKQWKWFEKFDKQIWIYIIVVNYFGLLLIAECYH